MKGRCAYDPAAQPFGVEGLPASAGHGDRRFHVQRRAVADDPRRAGGHFAGAAVRRGGRPSLDPAGLPPRGAVRPGGDGARGHHLAVLPAIVRDEERQGLVDREAEGEAAVPRQHRLRRRRLVRPVRPPRRRCARGGAGRLRAAPGLRQFRARRRGAPVVQHQRCLPARSQRRHRLRGDLAAVAAGSGRVPPAGTVAGQYRLQRGLVPLRHARRVRQHRSRASRPAPARKKSCGRPAASVSSWRPICGTI